MQVRELYEAVVGGTERRLRFLKCGVGLPSESKFFDALHRADLIVSAFGCLLAVAQTLD